MDIVNSIVKDVINGKMMVVDKDWYNQRKAEWLDHLKSAMNALMIDTPDKEAIIMYMEEMFGKETDYHP